jgi:hypothetical protein
MSIVDRMRENLSVLARSERGMAVPTALAVLVASFGLASATVLSSVDVQTGSHRDQDAKSAIAAADAGASIALLRLNRFQSSITEATPCIGPAGELQSEATPGWCPVSTAEAVGGSSFSYQVSAFKKNSELSVVATGTAGTVSRRVDVGLISVTGKNVFADERVIGQDEINLVGTPDIESDVGTNGSVTLNGAASICGDIRHGIGKTASDPSCGGEILEGNKELPAVSPPTNIATVNSNCRLVPNCTGINGPKEVDTDATTGNGKNEKEKEKRTKTEPWNATKRTINVGGQATLTMGGADYFVCGLYVGPGKLIMAAGAHIRIFVDTPEHCGLAAGATQVEVGGNGSIVSTAYETTPGNYDLPGIYVLGSGSVVLGGNGETNELMLYAPFSKIKMDGNSTWKGMIAGKSLELKGTPKIVSNPNMTPPEITLKGLWQRTHYVECTGAAVVPPNAYC